VILDVFNLFNNNEVLEEDQDYTFEGDENFHLWADESNLDEFGNPKFNPSLPASPFYRQPRSGSRRARCRSGLSSLSEDAEVAKDAERRGAEAEAQAGAEQAQSGRWGRGRYGE
jgi:hypothetical protein